MKYSYDIPCSPEFVDNVFGYAFRLIQQFSIPSIVALHIAIGYYYGELEADLFSLDYNVQEKISRTFSKWANYLMSRI